LVAENQLLLAVASSYLAVEDLQGVFLGEEVEILVEEDLVCQQQLAGSILHLQHSPRKRQQLSFSLEI